MTFDPTSIFVNTGNLSSAQAKRLEQRDEVDSKSRLFRLNVQRGEPVNPVTRTAPSSSRLTAEIAAMIQALEQAAARFAVRRDQFAAGKSDTCLDIAAKLQRFGSFASDRQAEFAAKLVEWSKPREQATSAWTQSVEAAKAEVRAEPPVVVLPKLFDLMQRLSTLEIGTLKLARKNQDSLCWIKRVGRDGVIGKLTGAGTLAIFHGRLGDLKADALVDALLEIEKDPEAAAVLHGKTSGRCAVCSRDLTDPQSIARGIGPICAEKF